MGRIHENNPQSQPSARSDDLEALVHAYTEQNAFALRVFQLASLGSKDVNTILAISALNPKPESKPGTPYTVTMAAIYAKLSLSPREKTNGQNTARLRAQHLLNESQPTIGKSFITRFTALQDSGEAHRYADYWTWPVITQWRAFREAKKGGEWRSILKTKDHKERAIAKQEFEDRYALAALAEIPACDARLITPDNKPWAYMPAPAAIAYCAEREGWSYKEVAPKTEKPKSTITTADDEERWLNELIARIDRRGDKWEQEFNTDIARDKLRRLQVELNEAINSWLKTHGAQSSPVTQDPEPEFSFDLEPESDEEEGGKGINTWSDFASYSEGVPPLKMRGGTGANSFEINTPEKSHSASPDVEFEQESLPKIEASINFDSALEAAIFYARDGWPVIPICQFDPAKNRCTASWHSETCTGRKPLMKGEKTGGYDAATLDQKLIRKWFTRDFPSAGIGIRLDDHVLIDCDVKDGARGLESYEVLRDTFDLPETLTAITHSGGRHYVFKLPADLSPGFLKSWTRPLDKIALGGIDLKVGKNGLLYAEPTRGSKGIYRWVDPSKEPATLPIVVCEFFNEIRYRDDPAKARKGPPSLPRSPVTDQSKCFRDVPRGERHRRLFIVGVAARYHDHRSADEIADIQRYHAAHFSEPLDDEPWILRTSQQIAARF